MQEVEDKKHQSGGVAGVRCGLDHAERGDAVRKGAAQFAVKIGRARAERRHGLGDRRVFVRPVEPGAGQQLDGAAVEARMHAVAVEFDFVQPLVAVRGGVDQLGQLRRDPTAAERPAARNALPAGPCRQRKQLTVPAHAPPRSTERLAGVRAVHHRPHRDEKLITAHWNDVLRFVTSIRTGAVSASLLLKRLGAYPRQNSLALALREIGQIERTVFMLDWLELPGLRRQAGHRA
jgi:hypothetical protein